MQSHTYRMTPRHGDRTARDPLQYRLEVTPDLYPTIHVETRPIARRSNVFSSAVRWVMTTASNV
jgi:hypothetical protein